jgi:hypothetical protein
VKKLMTKIACVAALVAPAASFANTSTDHYSFDLLVKSVVSIGANWIDSVLTTGPIFNPTFHVLNANDLGWTLTGNNGFAGSSSPVTDGSGILGSTTLNLGTLDAGTYSLTFTGVWNGLGGIRTPGFVNLKDGDNLLDPSTFVATPVAAVPEPETYALMLAGLMMVGTIARRRSRSK